MIMLKGANDTLQNFLERFEYRLKDDKIMQGDTVYDINKATLTEGILTIYLEARCVQKRR
jgi:hypothetical protein